MVHPTLRYPMSRLWPIGKQSILENSQLARYDTLVGYSRAIFQSPLVTLL